jgi:acetyltransferase-like isoleucine patch superfamily enzyme
MIIDYLGRITHVMRIRHRFPKSIIHKHVKIDGSSRLDEFSIIFPEVRILNSVVGSFSYVQEGGFINSTDIGPFCSIAANAVIGLPNHPLNMVSTSPVFYDESQPMADAFSKNNFARSSYRTTIGADVWIGDGVKIIAGVSIGVGAVIGAGSIVTRNIEPYSIAVGIPCRPIKKRFSNEVCDLLHQSSWWNLDRTLIKKLSPFFNDPIIFLRELEKLKKL